MPSIKPGITLRLDHLMHQKLKYIADDGFRTINGELTMLITKRIEEYEAEHGKIALPAHEFPYDDKHVLIYDPVTQTYSVRPIAESLSRSNP